MLGRINPVMTAGDDGNGAACEAGAMSGGIDAACQSGHDGEPGFAQVVRQPLGDFDACGGCIARADNCDQRPRQHGELAAYGQQRRTIVDHLQPPRIIGFAKGDEFDAAHAGRGQFGLGLFDRTDARRARPTAAARKAG